MINTVRRLAHPMLCNSPQFSVTVRARDSFYMCYTSNPLARCWRFLQPYHHSQSDCPTHLRLAIDALSLAYFWHELDSRAALLACMQTYILAIGNMGKAISSRPLQIGRDTATAALVLDIVDKILTTGPLIPSTHIDGAFSLVKAAGFIAVPSSPDFAVLLSMTNSSMIASIAREEPFHPDVVSIRSILEQQIDEYPRGIIELSTQYADLQHAYSTKQISGETYAREAYMLDCAIAVMESELPDFW